MHSLVGLITANYDGGDFGILTKERPVASLPFGGRYRLIDFPLSSMVNSGITTVGLITPHQYRSLMDHVGVGKEWALSRKVGGLFILPGSIYGNRNLRGKLTIRDIRINRPFLDRTDSKHVLITGSSMVYNIDYAEVEKLHEESGNDITFIYKKGLFTNSKSSLYLNFENDRLKSVQTEANEENVCFLDAFIIDSKVLFKALDLFEEIGHMDLVDDIIAQHLNELKVGGFEFKGYVGPVYDLQSYLEASQDLLAEEVRDELFNNSDRPIHTKVQDAPPAKYTAGCEISASLISSGCIIEGKVENSIIFRDVHVAKGAVVRNSVLMQHCDVGEGAKLEHIICDKYVTINDGVQLSSRYGSPLAIAKTEKI